VRHVDGLVPRVVRKAYRVADETTEAVCALSKVVRPFAMALTGI
jgi:hypothetical protein